MEAAGEGQGAPGSGSEPQDQTIVAENATQVAAANGTVPATDATALGSAESGDFVPLAPTSALKTEQQDDAAQGVQSEAVAGADQVAAAPPHPDAGVSEAANQPESVATAPVKQEQQQQPTAQAQGQENHEDQQHAAAPGQQQDTSAPQPDHHHQQQQQEPAQAPEGAAPAAAAATPAPLADVIAAAAAAVAAAAAHAAAPAPAQLAGTKRGPPEEGGEEKGAGGPEEGAQKAAEANEEEPASKAQKQEAQRHGPGRKMMPR